MKKGFTLIELLIVVAIIAILAAMAVPNFLEAQTRSKVSRFMADMKAAATGLEAYAVDYNRYPPPDAVPVGTDESIAGPWWPIVLDPPENYLPRRLTTPIAYVTSLPIDIFDHHDPLSGLPRWHAPHYVNDQFNSRSGLWAGQVENEWFVARTKGALKINGDPGTNVDLYDMSAVWMVHTHGPDRDHDDFLAAQGYPTLYDPSNGTVSDGDIFYFGPGTGFSNR